jgi:hypothetical protein
VRVSCDSGGEDGTVENSGVVPMSWHPARIEQVRRARRILRSGVMALF